MSKLLGMLLLCTFFISCNGSKSSDTSFGDDSTEPNTTDRPLTAADVLAVESSIVSSGTIVANGVSSAVVTITLKAAGALPVSGVTPTFTATNTATTNVYRACSITNSLGVSTCTMSSSTPETKILHVTSPVTFDGGNVVFINDNVDHVASFISADDLVVADGATASVVRIKLVDLEGNPFTGTPTFKATNTAATNTYGTCSALSVLGESTCSLKTTKAEAKRLEILSPAYLSGDTIHFIAGAPDAANSTITGTASVVANGVATSLVTILLKDSFLNPVPDLTPTYSATDSGSKNIYTPCVPSDVTGKSLCYMSSKKAEAKTLTLNSPVSVVGGVTTFIPGAASATYSSIVGTTNVLADGSATSTVSIVLKDVFENPITATVPTFTATDSGTDNAYGACAATDATGATSCLMTSLSPEVKTLRLTSPLFSDGGTVKYMSPGINLTVPIDLLDRGLASNTTATIFDRTLYPLTTTDYVATSNSYYFELVGTNSHATIDYTVDLLGNSNVVLATITVPKVTSLPTRLRSAAITMPAGTNNLKIRVNASAVASQVTVQMAKLLIKQVGATQTKLWFPLTAYDHSGFANTVLLPVIQTSIITLGASSTYGSRWTRNDSIFTELDSSAYKLETLMSTNNAAGIASVGLHNVTDNIAVTNSAINLTGTTYQWGSVALNDATTFLNNKIYEVRYKANLATYIAYFFKAGISIKLTNLSKAEIYNRLYLRRALTTTSALGGGRVKWDIGDYSHPKTYVETHGYISAGGSASRELDDMGTSDSAVATPLVVTDSTLPIQETLDNYRTPELFLTDANRLVLYDRVNSGTLFGMQSFLVIKSSLR